MTPAIRILREAGVDFTPYQFEYERHPGAEGAAIAIGTPLHGVIKTLVMESDANAALLVLMHGDLEVSTKALARELGVKSVAPTTPELAHRLTGYRVGGISPFGTKTKLPVYAQKTISELDQVQINAGKRGFLVGMATADLLALLEPTLMEIVA